MKGFDRFVNCLSEGMGTVAAILCIFLSVNVTLNVIFRYLLHSSMPGGMELNQYLFCAITMLATALSIREDGHVRVDIFRTRMGTSVVDICDFLTSPLLIIIGGILLWFSMDEFRLAVIFNKRSNTDLGVPLWIVWGILVIGSVGFFLEGVNSFIISFKKILDKSY